MSSTSRTTLDENCWLLKTRRFQQSEQLRVMDKGTRIVNRKIRILLLKTSVSGGAVVSASRFGKSKRSSWSVPRAARQTHADKKLSAWRYTMRKTKKKWSWNQFELLKFRGTRTEKNHISSLVWARIWNEKVFCEGQSLKKCLYRAKYLWGKLPLQRQSASVLIARMSLGRRLLIIIAFF